jgi:hypothetical protein
MPDEIIQISPHFTCESRLDGKLTIYKLTNTDRETIERWATEVVARRRAFKPDELALVLHDFSEPALALTPFLRSRALELSNVLEAQQVKIAIAFPKDSILRGLIVPILQGFQRTVTAAHPERSIQLFESREAALTWLQSFLIPP